MRKFSACALAVCCWIASGPTRAATAETDAFVANVRLNTVFLARSSDLAAERSDDPALRTFAAAERSAVDAVTAAIDTRCSPMLARTEAAAMTSSALVTGRSVAVAEAKAGTPSRPDGVGALMPAAMVTLDHLAARKGQGFDTLYVAVQINALRQLAALYNAYSLTGDDAMLRQMAGAELAATQQRIAAIGRL